jgi:transmembrane sensor
MPSQEHIYRITELTQKKLDGSLTPEEGTELEVFLAADVQNRTAFERRIDPDTLDQRMAIYMRAKEEWSARYEEVRGVKPAKGRTIGVSWFYVAAAAAVLLVGTSILLMFNRHRQEPPQSLVSQDLKPGGNKAILTLASGSTVVLDSAQNGTIAVQGSSTIVKLPGGQLAYKTGGGNTAAGSNTVSTPVGGTYQVMLPDGSKAWLNAQSSIRFPAAFTGNSREVSITGEVYMEIAKDPRKPFKVTVKDMTVSVLGTSFDVMAYDGEPMTTTLIQGAVAASRNGQKVLLKQGEQAEAGSRLMLHPNADIEAITAWKDGLFIFNHASIETVMNALSRWYGVPVRYEGSAVAHRITGILKRDNYASKSLAILEANGYHFKIMNGTIVVLP